MLTEDLVLTLAPMLALMLIEMLVLTLALVLIELLVLPTRVLLRITLVLATLMLTHPTSGSELYMPTAQATTAVLPRDHDRNFHAVSHATSRTTPNSCQIPAKFLPSNIKAFDNDLILMMTTYTVQQVPLD